MPASFSCMTENTERSDPRAPDARPGPAAVCGVMVTYAPDPAGLADALRGAVASLDALVVVDNSADPIGRQRVAEAVRSAGPARAGAAIGLISGQGNVGLARALNLGLARAQQDGFGLFLLLDHDSVVDRAACEALLAARGELAPSGPTVALAAQNVDAAPTGLQARLEEILYGYSTGARRAPRRCALAMTSGMFLSAAALRAAGPFDESLFLDAVDHEFCLRSFRRGVPLFVVPRAQIRHALGRPQPAHWGPFRVTLREADPQRLYFSTRDTLRVAIRYLAVRPFVGGTMIAFVASRSVVYTLFARQERGWFHAILNGWVDFLRAAPTPRRAV